MKNNFIIKNLTPILLSAYTLLLFIPILIKSSILLNRNNDLQEQFWPVFYFIKQQTLIHHTFPFWNNLFLAGTPLLPDPQFSLFYPFNLLFILFPTNLAFILYFIIHSFLASIGIYLLGKKVFNFSKTTNLIMAMIYASTPKMSGFIEAGHIGLFATFAWFPFVLLSLLKLSKKPNIKWSLLLGISLAGIFYTHTVIFVLTIVSSAILFVLLIIYKYKRSKISLSLILTIIGLVLAFGFIAITLLPQIDWLPQTTRFLLLQNKDVYPKWNSIKEFLQIVSLPLTLGIRNIQGLDGEKWITTGSSTLLLAFYGFWRLRTKYKILVTGVFIVVTLIALNNSSPLFSKLILQDWYILMRVSTRVWFIPILVIILLAGFALEQIKIRGFGKKIIILISFLIISEQLILSYIYLLKPTSINSNSPTDALYHYLQSDDIYRVYCVNRCIPQQEAALYNLQLVDGYNTLQQENFYQEAWQLTGAYWNYYTLSIPPIGTYTFEKPQPDPISLGEFNTKYVISPYLLTNKNFQLEKTFDSYFVYRNNLFKPRAYFLSEQSPDKFIEAPIIKYSPNEIIVSTREKTSNKLTLSEVYSSGWKAYLNGDKKVIIQEKPNRLRQVDILPNTESVTFKYQPKSYEIGLMITLGTIGSILIYYLFLLKRSRFNN